MASVCGICLLVVGGLPDGRMLLDDSVELALMGCQPTSTYKLMYLFLILLFRLFFFKRALYDHDLHILPFRAKSILTWMSQCSNEWVFVETLNYTSFPYIVSTKKVTWRQENMHLHLLLTFPFWNLCRWM